MKKIWKKIVSFMTIMPTAEKPLVLKDEIDLKDLWNGILRKKKWLFLTAGLFFSGSVLFTLHARIFRPVFRGSFTLLISDPMGSEKIERSLYDSSSTLFSNISNRDSKYDLLEESVQEGLFGINIHRATGRSGGKSIRVDKWSAGCQVIADNDDWHTFLDICQSAREIWGNSFTYTLLESEDIA